MKLYKFLFILIFPFCFSQNKNTKGYVFYGEYISINFGPRNSPEERGNLIFDFKKQESIYYTGKDSLNQEFELRNKEEVYSKSGKPEEGGAIYLGDYDPEESLQKVYTTKDSVMNYFRWGSKKYGDIHYFKEKKSNLNWKLEKESKTIGNYNCYKASCYFRGRTYIAWYTPDIPAPFGPWKLQGLPGLILEAYTPNEEIYYYAKNIIYPFNDDKPIDKIKLEKGYQWITSLDELFKRQHNLNLDAYEQTVLIIESIGNPNAKAVKNKDSDIFREIN